MAWDRHHTLTPSMSGPFTHQVHPQSSSSLSPYTATVPYPAKEATYHSFTVCLSCVFTLQSWLTGASGSLVWGFRVPFFASSFGGWLLGVFSVTLLDLIWADWGFSLFVWSHLPWLDIFLGWLLRFSFWVTWICISVHLDCFCTFLLSLLAWLPLHILPNPGISLLYLPGGTTWWYLPLLI